jgi:hypothetical protein
MIKSEIQHRGTLKAIEKYEITDYMLENIENIDVLRLLIKNMSRRVWQRQHKDYYAKRYQLVSKGEYEVGKVVYDKTPLEITLEIKDTPERTKEYMRQYNREYYHRKRKISKVVPIPRLCCEKCKNEIGKELEVIPEEQPDD